MNRLLTFTIQYYLISEVQIGTGVTIYSLGTNLVTQCQTRSIARREKSFVVKIPSLQKKKAVSPTFTIEQKLLCLTQSFFFLSFFEMSFLRQLIDF